MQLPSSSSLPIHLLASVFKNTTATYKYYWFIGLIEALETGKTEISKRELFARMISNSWYTINYFHLSFGAFDLIQQASSKIANIEDITIDAHKSDVLLKVLSSEHNEVNRALNHFNSNVPHWFLSPWFPKCSKKEIYQGSQDLNSQALYALRRDNVVIHPIWVNYLFENAKVLKDFCYWNLALFLQIRNPNVPDIPGKLVKPATRNSLLKQTKNYWKVVFDELGSIECIFTGNQLEYSKKNFAIDHFIPYAFVSHDLIWNLIPIDSRFNSVKSDRLPNSDESFRKFMELQKAAFDINLNLNRRNKFIEEYLTIFPTVNEFNENLFENTIQPLLTIASNNGFQYLSPS